MQTPYEILDVLVDANDDQIKQAYLRKVKDNPPDRDQDQFQLIHNAYIAIKDIKSRTRLALFTLPNADFGGVIDQMLTTDPMTTLNAEQFQQLLSASIDDTTFSTMIASLKK